MKQIKYVSLMLILVLLATGCVGNYGNLKMQTRSESKATKQQLIHSWSDYDIWLHYHEAYKPPRITIIIFDPKNYYRKISVGRNWRMVKDQQMWTEIVRENTASDGEFTLVWDDWGPYYTTSVQEIWSSDNQFFGYIVYQAYAVELERVELVDENTIQLSWHPPNTLKGSGK